MEILIRVKNRDGHLYNVNVYDGKKIACKLACKDVWDDAIDGCTRNIHCCNCPFAYDDIKYTQEEVINIIRNSNEFNVI